MKNPSTRKNQYKDTCTTCDRYGHNGKDFCHKESTNITKFHFCDKTGHVKKYFWNIIREEKSNNNNNKDKKKIYNYCKMNNHKEKYCYKKNKA